ncbi:hypothetical protein [Phaeovibrio sulfidiphilus]|nr:hypothetical protein [Phaeovibrio sulfidiphilus]
MPAVANGPTPAATDSNGSNDAVSGPGTPEFHLIPYCVPLGWSVV